MQANMSHYSECKDGGLYLKSPAKLRAAIKGLSIETESPRPGTTGGSKVSLLNLHAPAICITPEGCPAPNILPWNLLALPIHPIAVPSPKCCWVTFLVMLIWPRCQSAGKPSVGSSSASLYGYRASVSGTHSTLTLEGFSA